MVTDHDMRMEALRLFEENERLVKALKAACGYLMNAKIDLSTNCTKAMAIRTIEDGIKLAQGSLASVGNANE